MFSNSNFFLGANQHICIYGLQKNSIDQIIFSFYQNRIMFGLKKLRTMSSLSELWLFGLEKMKKMSSLSELWLFVLEKIRKM